MVVRRTLRPETERTMSSSVRKVVSDYVGNDLARGDLGVSASRTGNRVRVADYIVLKTTTKKGPLGRRIPTLVVLPTGDESGFVKRASMRIEEIGAEHFRLIEPGYAQRNNIELP